MLPLFLRIAPMEYPEITQTELYRYLMNIKKIKATVPDYKEEVKCEWQNCKTLLQNIIDKDLKIKPIALTYVYHKLFMTRKTIDKHNL